MKSTGGIVRDAWENFLLYLPLTCLGILALTTYWMVRSTPKAGAPIVAAMAQHAPDYFMEGFSIKTYDPSGHLRSEILGDKARHYPDAQWLEIDAIRIRSIDDKGHLTTATANRGLTNEDGSQVQLIGNAVVIREPGPATAGAQPPPRMEYRGEFLHAFITSEQVLSNQPVELIRGKDRFTADSMHYDNVEQVLQLEGRVRGTITPTPVPVPTQPAARAVKR